MALLQVVVPRHTLLEALLRRRRLRIHQADRLLIHLAVAPQQPMLLVEDRLLTLLEAVHLILLVVPQLLILLVVRLRILREVCLLQLLAVLRAAILELHGRPVVAATRTWEALPASARYVCA